MTAVYYRIRPTHTCTQQSAVSSTVINKVVSNIIKVGFYQLLFIVKKLRYEKYTETVHLFFIHSPSTAAPGCLLYGCSEKLPKTSLMPIPLTLVPLPLLRCRVLSAALTDHGCPASQSSLRTLGKVIHC